MVYNTEDGVSLQKLPDKSQISEKRQSILLLETRKKDSKTLKTRETRLARSLYNHSRQSKSSKGNAYEEIDQELHISGNAGMITK